MRGPRHAWRWLRDPYCRHIGCQWDTHRHPPVCRYCGREYLYMARQPELGYTTTSDPVNDPW